MRRLWIFALLITLTAIAAQAQVEQPAYGPVVAYGAVVPEIATVNISNSPVGATNATGNNLAGARDSTVGNVPGLSYASMAVSVYLQPFPAAETAAREGLSSAEPVRLAGVAGAVYSPSAYGHMTDPLAVAARTQRGNPRPTAGRLFTNADLQRVARDSERTGSAAVSMVRRTITPETEAAQAVHDRNLGIEEAHK